MALKRQLERLQKWACNKANNSCEKCSYSVYGGRYLGTEVYSCAIGIAADAARDRAKEGTDNDS